MCNVDIYMCNVEKNIKPLCFDTIDYIYLKNFTIHLIKTKQPQK